MIDQILLNLTNHKAIMNKRSIFPFTIYKYTFIGIKLLRASVEGVGSEIFRKLRERRSVIKYCRKGEVLRTLVTQLLAL